MHEPDYYAILQVHRLADPDVIEATYRRLMLKYHPDVLSAAERGDPEKQRRVREINEAYAVLRDTVKRAAYDRQLELEQQNAVQPVEMRWYSASCSSTGARFRINLARQQGSKGVFRVVGFEGLVIPPRKRRSLIEWTLKLLRISKRLRHSESSTSQRNLSQDEIESLLDESKSLDFGTIDWGGYHCPACSGTFTFTDGMLSTWTSCGNCGRVCCAGGIKHKRSFGVFTCPSCNAVRRVTFHVPVGKIANQRVGGMVKTSDSTPAVRAIEGKSQRSLPSDGD